jgi:hypothetical protein
VRKTHPHRFVATSIRPTASGSTSSSLRVIASPCGHRLGRAQIGSFVPFCRAGQPSAGRLFEGTSMRLGSLLYADQRDRRRLFEAALSASGAPMAA